MPLDPVIRRALLWLWPYYAAEVQTELDGTEAVRRLKTLIEPSSLWFPNYRRLKGHYIGRVTDRGFFTTRLMHHVAAYIPLIRGKILDEDPSGVRIRIVFLQPNAWGFVLSLGAGVLLGASAGAPLYIVIGLMFILHIVMGEAFEREVQETMHRFQILLANE